MEPKISNFTPIGTGNKSVSGIPFLPKRVSFYMAQGPSSPDTVAHYSHGEMTSTKQMAHSIYADTTGGKTVSSFAKCVSHLKRVSGTITETTTATFVSFDNNGGGDYGFTLNFSANDGTKIYFVAEP